MKIAASLLRRLSPVSVASVAVLFAIANLLLHWPGSLTRDSETQLKEAISGSFTDWHPPIMAAIWRALLGLSVGPEPMLVLQVGVHWLGIGLISATLLQRGHPRAALIMLVSGFTPMSLKYTGVILKDSLLAGILLAGFGFASRTALPARCTGVFLGLVGMLSRANGVFAVAPLIFLSFRNRWSGAKLFLYAVTLSLLLIPISQWFNHHVLGATRTGVERALQLYDLTGIAYFSGDKSVLPVEIPDLERCYTPLYWDTLATPRCEGAFRKIESGLAKHWLLAIAAHPFAYARHRLEHFNREIFFLVPPAQQCVEAPEAHDCPRTAWSDAIEKNGLLWPVVWLALAAVMLHSGLAELPKALCVSALLYGLGYLLVGVAVNFRYYYWTELAVQTALIFQVAVSGFPKWRRALAVVLMIWLAGYAWRAATIF